MNIFYTNLLQFGLYILIKYTEILENCIGAVYDAQYKGFQCDSKHKYSTIHIHKTLQPVYVKN